VQLVSSGIDTVGVVRIDNKDKTLGILVVVTPERANLVLASDIPDGERNVLILNSFDVEPCKETRGMSLPKLVGCSGKMCDHQTK
jgi:hypothetical protein